MCEKTKTFEGSYLQILYISLYLLLILCFDLPKLYKAPSTRNNFQRVLIFFRRWVFASFLHRYDLKRQSFHHVCIHVKTLSRVERFWYPIISLVPVCTIGGNASTKNALMNWYIHWDWRVFILHGEKNIFTVPWRFQFFCLLTCLWEMIYRLSKRVLRYPTFIRLFVHYHCTIYTLHVKF